MKKWLILAGVLCAAAIALAQVQRFPQGGTGSPGPFASGSRICSDGVKFVACTATPTHTPTSTPTVTPTATPTFTPSNTPTITPTPTVTNTPTNTPTSTNTPTATPTPISSSTIDETLWQKSFFVNNGLLPTTAYKDSVSTFPSVDYTFSGTNHTWSADLAWVKDTATASGQNGLKGWDLGANKAKVFLALGGVGSGGAGTGQFQELVVAQHDLSGGVRQSGYAFRCENNNSRWSIYKISGAGAYTLIGNYGSSSTMYPPQHADAYPVSTAILADGTANAMMMFIRANGGQWMRILNISDSTVTSFRYVGFSGITPGVAAGENWFVAPAEVWYTP